MFLVIVQKQQQYMTGHASYWAVSSKTSDRLLIREKSLRIWLAIFMRNTNVLWLEELINFWHWSGPWYRFKTTFPLTIAEHEILGDLLAFLIQSPADWRDDWCQQGNESTTFCERSARHPDPNPEMWIRIVDHFWLRFRPWRRFALSEHTLVLCCVGFLFSTELCLCRA